MTKKTEIELSRLTVKWPRSGPCPCGSKQVYEECCSGKDGFPSPKQFSLTPPGRTTVFSHTSCYLHSDQNCSEKISREHYISQAILKQLPGLWVEGMPWQEKGQRTNYPTNALASKILCTRHNSSLAPLDLFVSRAFECFREAMSYPVQENSTKKTKYFIIDGHSLELWAFKTLLGLLSARIAQVKDDLCIQNYSSDFRKAYRALKSGRMISPLGLHVGIDTGNEVKNIYGFAPFVNPEKKRLVGLVLTIHGLVLNFIFDTTELPVQRLYANSQYRPWVINFVGTAKTSRLIIPWENETKPSHITVNIA